MHFDVDLASYVLKNSQNIIIFFLNPDQQLGRGLWQAEITT